MSPPRIHRGPAACPGCRACPEARAVSVRSEPCLPEPRPSGSGMASSRAPLPRGRGSVRRSLEQTSDRRSQGKAHVDESRDGHPRVVGVTSPSLRSSHRRAWSRALPGVASSATRRSPRPRAAPGSADQVPRVQRSPAPPISGRPRPGHPRRSNLTLAPPEPGIKARRRSWCRRGCVVADHRYASRLGAAGASPRTCSVVGASACHSTRAMTDARPGCHRSRSRG